MPAPQDNQPYKLVGTVPVPRLRSREDWPLWETYIKSTAQLCGVWKYFDPTNPTDEFGDLKAKLTEPTFKSVCKDAESIADLDDADFLKLRSLVQEYKENRDELLRKREIIEAIGDLVVESVARPFTAYVAWATPHEQLQSLTEALKGPSPEDLKELSSEWLALQQLADSPQIQQYATRWNTLFDKCKALGLACPSSHEKALGKSLLDSQSPATAWKPLQFQSWYIGDELFTSGDEDIWAPGLESHSEGDDKSQNEEGRSFSSWDTERGGDSGEEGEGDNAGVITWK